MTNLHELAWDVARLGDAMEALARHANLLPRPTHAPTAPSQLAQANDEDVARWVNVVARHISIEAEAVESLYADIDLLLDGVAPALLQLEFPQKPHHASVSNRTVKKYLAIIKGGRNVSVLAPDFSRQSVSADVLRDALVRPIEAPYVDAVDEILTRARVPVEKRSRVRRLFLHEQLSTTRVAQGWMLRHLPGASYVQQARTAKIIPLGALVGFTILLQQLFLILSWAIIGKGALQGHYDWVWLTAWAVLLLTAIPLQMLMSRAGTRLGIHLGGIYRDTLLYGALKLEPDDIRHEGIGNFLDRIMDADVVQYGGINSALTVMLASSQLIVAFGVLLLSATGFVTAGMLAAIVLLMLVLGWQHWHTSEWGSATYRAMTNNLVERLVGHRTRLAQQAPAAWHREEDRELSHYLEHSVSEARFGNWLGMLPQLWLILGLAGSVAAFILQPLSVGALAIMLGGVLLAQQALSAIAFQIAFFIPLSLAWRQVRPLLDAARREEDGSLASTFSLENSPRAEQSDTRSETQSQANSQTPLLALREVAFRYRERARAALEDVSLEIFPRDRILVQGPSGGGKSTLAAILAGLRVPEAGLLLLRGYDRASVGGQEWRQRVVIAPQFHENHVFAETFAFNLLMGRRWPPTSQDERDAYEVCAALGLTDLLARMPSGLHQIVGENGWQLSHGERSRLFIARALLQRSELIILDESFAALDPESLARALRCVLQRAPTLLVIAHP